MIIARSPKLSGHQRRLRQGCLDRSIQLVVEGEVRPVADPVRALEELHKGASETPRCFIVFIRFARFQAAFGSISPLIRAKDGWFSHILCRNTVVVALGISEIARCHGLDLAQSPPQIGHEEFWR